MTDNKQSVTKPVDEKNISDFVLSRINKFVEFGEINLSKNYSPANALKSAYLILTDLRDKNDKSVLQSCTKDSIANALLDMVMQGLSPVKKQCSFVAFGNKLTMMREYAGTIALAKRLGGLVRYTANVIYEGDEFLYEIDPLTGLKKITSHKQAFENININKIKGAYATLILQDNTTYVEVMTIAQIRQAWLQGYAKGNSKAHTNFTDQMAIKTVIGRACKLFIASSDDSDVFSDDQDDIVVETSKQIIDENANKDVIGFDQPEEPEVVETEEIEEPDNQKQQELSPDF